MSRVVVLPELDASVYQRNTLHADDRVWVEKNCYVDIWIEVVHALGLDPMAMLPFVAAIDFEGLSDKEEVLAYLPMAWIGEHIFSYVQAYCAGFCVSCPESPATALADLRELGPSYLFAPPRIFETILTQVMIRMEDAGWLKRRLFRNLNWSLVEVICNLSLSRLVPGRGPV